MSMTLVADDKKGKQTFRVDPGTHTILLDTSRIRQVAIAEFLKELSKRYTKHSAQAINEDIALAIGWFEVPFEFIYDGEVESIKDLDDDILAGIVRLRMEKEDTKKDEPST